MKRPHTLILGGSSGIGPATHMMLAGPGGIRLELIHRPA